MDKSRFSFALSMAMHHASGASRFAFNLLNLNLMFGSLQIDSPNALYCSINEVTSLFVRAVYGFEDAKSCSVSKKKNFGINIAAGRQWNGNTQAPLHG
jgi:hypothetical protein